MQRIKVGEVNLGERYRHHELRCVKRDGQITVEDVELGLWEAVAFCYDGTTSREMILMRALEEYGVPGRLYAWTLAAFATMFRPAPKPLPETPPEPEKPAGALEGSGF